MATVTAIEKERAYGISGVGTPYITALNLFEPGEEVYLLSDYPTTGSNSSVVKIPYTITTSIEQSEDLVGVATILDQTLNTATPATYDGGGTTRTITGFEHTAALVATVGSPTWSNPYFYDITRVSDGKVFRGIHQSQLNNLANIETYIAANIAAWWVA